MKRRRRSAAGALLLIAAVLFLGCGAGEAPLKGQPSRLNRPGHAQPGAEESLESFGMEAAGRERAAMLTAFRGYLKAIAAEDFPDACGYLSSGVQRALPQFSGEPPARLRCPAYLDRLLSTAAPAIAARQLHGQLKKVRADGPRGFVIYSAPGANLFEFSLVREGRAWKVDLLTGAVLVPSGIASKPRHQAG